MKYILLLFSLLTVSWVNAQGHYNGQSSIAVNYLATDKGNAYNFNFQKLIGTNYFGYRIDLLYIDRKDNLTLVNTIEVPHNIYSIGGSLTYSLEKIIPYPFYIQLLAGGQYGYEELKFESNNIEYKKPNPNTYGAIFGAEIEYLIVSNFSVIATSLNRISFNSQINTFNPNYGFGVKYNF